MSVIDRVKQHFDDISEVRIVEVPEWGDTPDAPLKVYIKPMNLNEKQILYRRAKGDDLAVLVDAVIMKAMDEKGELMFDKGDRRALMRNADPAVLERLAAEILGTTDVEDYEKN